MPIALQMLRSLGDVAFTALTSSPNLIVSFSQQGEDIVIGGLVDEIFGPRRPGFFVDVGALDSQRFSNTFLLSLRGWRGVNIDANPDNVAALRRDRPNDLNICIGVSDQDGEAMFYRFAEPALSTFSFSKAQHLMAVGWELKDRVKIPLRSLDSILNEVVPIDVNLDFLNVDIEGMDEQAILSMQFQRVRPTILAAEFKSIDPLRSCDVPVIVHLVDHGYRLVANCRGTYIFTDSNYVPTA